MNDFWRHADGRWNTAERTRVARLFRAHVRAPWNPRGRIHREACPFHPKMVGEAHHVDYERPFLVAWLCQSCHRKVDHGGLRLYKKYVWDYTSLIDGIAKLGLRRAQRSTRAVVGAVPF